jgi:hypothetical protein
MAVGSFPRAASSQIWEDPDGAIAPAMKVRQRGVAIRFEDRGHQLSAALQSHHAAAAARRKRVVGLVHDDQRNVA